MGAKIPLNGTSKVNRQTDRQTKKQTYGHLTYRKHRPTGPLLWKLTKAQIWESCKFVLFCVLLRCQAKDVNWSLSLYQIILDVDWYLISDLWSLSFSPIDGQGEFLPIWGCIEKPVWSKILEILVNTVICFLIFKEQTITYMSALVCNSLQLYWQTAPL